MVKTLLFIAILIITSPVSAQDVRISWEDDFSMPYNGQEITVSGSGSTIYTNFHVVNESPKDTFVWRRDLISVSSQGFDDQLCDDQICYTTSGNPWICPGPLPIEANDSSLFQPKLLTNGNGGTAHMRYFVLDKNENKLDSVDVIFSSSASLEAIDINEVTIYPNPAEKNLTIENLPASAQEVVVMDALGKEVLSMRAPNPKSNIDISDLKSGIYFVRIKAKNGGVSDPKKLIIKR